MRSDALKKGLHRAPARAMLKATGLSDADLDRPLVAIANTWTEVTPCNVHLRELAEHVKAGVRAAGGTPIECNTIVVSDGVTMGTEGMRGSLVSREVIADSIELFVMSHSLDGVVALTGCDKTIPAAAMALARLDVPGLVLYGGPTEPGVFEGREVTIQDVFEAVGAHATGAMTPARLALLEDRACPGAGACGGQFTANTMSVAVTMLGLSPMGANEVAAEDPAKLDEARRCGELVMRMIADDRRPSQLLTRAAFDNAIAGAAATAGPPVFRPVVDPVKPRGGFAILRGSLAPDGCVVKLAGHDRNQHTGPARVFDGEEAAFAAVQAQRIEPGDVVVIRHEGPTGSPGMRALLAVTAALGG